MSEDLQFSPPTPQGALLRRAAEPTRRRLLAVTGRVHVQIRPFLEKLSERFLDPSYTVDQIRREAGATDWHVRLFGQELGIPPGELRGALRVEVTTCLLRETSLPLEKISRLVGYDSLRALQGLFRRSCQFTPSKGRTYLRQVRAEYRELGDEIRGWYFWVRLHRGELEAEDFDRAAAYLLRRFDPS
jgi:transcriptional regulator GlxA family with amidase domain